jgi:predicted outer membrane protein
MLFGAVPVRAQVENDRGNDTCCWRKRRRERHGDKKDEKTMKEMAFEAGKLASRKTQNEQVKAFAQTDTFDAKELNGFATAMEPSSSIWP